MFRSVEIPSLVENRYLPLPFSKTLSSRRDRIGIYLQKCLEVPLVSLRDQGREIPDRAKNIGRAIRAEKSFAAGMISHHPLGRHIVMSRKPPPSLS